MPAALTTWSLKLLRKRLFHRQKTRHQTAQSKPAVIHLMKTETLLMDNDDYPRYPAQIMVMGELNTLAHKIIQCQRHSH